MNYIPDLSPALKEAYEVIRNYGKPIDNRTIGKCMGNKVTQEAVRTRTSRLLKLGLITKIHRPDKGSNVWDYLPHIPKEVTPGWYWTRPRETTAWKPMQVFKDENGVLFLEAIPFASAVKTYPDLTLVPIPYPNE